ncbi:unnamed protein product [Parajaminaea phylloscopi]
MHLLHALRALVLVSACLVATDSVIAKNIQACCKDDSGFKCHLQLGGCKGDQEGPRAGVTGPGTKLAGTFWPELPPCTQVPP